MESMINNIYIYINISGVQKQNKVALKSHDFSAGSSVSCRTKAEFVIVRMHAYTPHSYTQ